MSQWLGALLLWQRSWHSHGISPPSIILVPGDLICSSDLCGNQAWMWYTYIQSGKEVTHKIKWNTIQYIYWDNLSIVLLFWNLHWPHTHRGPPVSASGAGILKALATIPDCNTIFLKITIIIVVYVCTVCVCVCMHGVCMCVCMVCVCVHTHTRAHSHAHEHFAYVEAKGQLCRIVSRLCFCGFWGLSSGFRL